MSVLCKLLSAKKKRVRTQCRLDVLGKCRHDRITYYQDCWCGTLSRTSIELVISETVLQLLNCPLLVETVSNQINDATSLTE